MVFPDEICAERSRPIMGSLVETTRCAPISPIVYTFDSPGRREQFVSLGVKRRGIHFK